MPPAPAPGPPDAPAFALAYYALRVGLWGHVCDDLTAAVRRGVKGLDAVLTVLQGFRAMGLSGAGAGAGLSPAAASDVVGAMAACGAQYEEERRKVREGAARERRGTTYTISPSHPRLSLYPPPLPPPPPLQ